MKTCPFCHKEKENVTPRRVRLPIPGKELFATSKEPMCDDCFNTMEDTFSKQGDNITKGV